MNERIKELRKSLGLTLEEFGARIGIGKSAASKIEKGVNGTTDQTIRSICREFHVREAWLREGEGDMYEAETRPDDVEAFLRAKNLEGLEADVVRAYLELPADMRRAFLEYFSNYFKDKPRASAPPGDDEKGDAPHDDQ